MNARRTLSAVVVIASLAVAPAASATGRAHGAAGGHARAGAGAVHGGTGRLHIGGHIFVNPGASHHQFTPHHGASRRFGHRSGAVGVFAPAVVYAAPYAYGAAYPYASAAPSYEPPDLYDSGPSYGSAYPSAVGTVAVAPSPPAPPTPTVVQYATGRYELRGDGATTAYTWIWVPNPPPPPPAAAPPVATPAPVDSGVRLSTLYHWTDEEGVVHWTDRLQAVPERYREETKSPAR